MAFHEHSTLTVTRLEDGNLELECTTCGKTWQSGFQVFRTNDAKGKITDRGLRDSLTGVRIPCDGLDGTNRKKDTAFIKFRKGANVNAPTL